MKFIFRCVLLLGMLLGSVAQAANPQIEFHTSHGSFVMELYPDKAPNTVANFLAYVGSGFYEGTIFHRVIDSFVVQGGGLTADLHKKKTQDPILNEANNGLKNSYGMVAMARLYDANSAAAQFFINLAENKTLNYTGPDSAHMGYCVFGRVIKGMDVVQKISQEPTQAQGKMPDVPVQPISIEKVAVLETPVLAENAIQPEDKPKQVNAPAKSVKKGKKKRG